MPRVHPVPGHYLATVPAVEHDCDDPFCVESGAFTEDQPADAPDDLVDDDATDQPDTPEEEQ